MCQLPLLPRNISKNISFWVFPGKKAWYISSSCLHSLMGTLACALLVAKVYIRALIQETMCLCAMQIRAYADNRPQALSDFPSHIHGNLNYFSLAKSDSEIFSISGGRRKTGRRDSCSHTLYFPIPSARQLKRGQILTLHRGWVGPRSFRWDF